MTDTDYLVVVREILEEILKIRDLEKRVKDLSELPIEDPELAEVVTGALAEGTGVHLAKKVQGMIDKYGGSIMGKPEAAYLHALAQYYMEGPYKNIAKELLDTLIENVGFPAIVSARLLGDGMHFLGEVVQKNRRDIMRIPYMGKVIFGKMQDKLGELGLSLDMDIDYQPPNQRSPHS
tara:strand:- start:736 stop:1269 length:534 start_codon:yes stop_codon:yes gene_type:complete